MELSEANQDSLLKIDKIPKAVTHAFYCLNRIFDAFLHETSPCDRKSSSILKI